MKKNVNRDFINLEFKRDFQRVIISSIILMLIAITAFVVSVITESKINSHIKVISVFIMICGVSLLIIGTTHVTHKKRNILKYIETFSFSTENTIRTAIFSYPDPIVIVSTLGIIKWFNPAFATLCGREDLFGTRIQDIFPAIRLSLFIESDKTQQEFSYNGKDFILTAEVSSTHEKDTEITTIGISFSDVSEITRLNKILDERRCVICTAVIDNYDEVLRETPNSSHGMLIGDIERCISLWVEKGNGFYRKYERDKFIILFEAAYFEVLKEEKFTVLDDVKAINHQNKIPATLSIGVAAEDIDMKSNDKLSVAALEMALGRGGDQAVLKTEDGYAFFGAKSLGVEKTTKVKARVVAKSLCSLIDNSSKVIIMGHKNADYDSFGAAVGLFRAVIDREKNAYIALDKNFNNVKEILSDFLRNPDYSERIISAERSASLVDENTLLIVVDTHRPSILEYSELLSKVGNIALIDHHRRSEEFIDNVSLTYHEPYASSTCEMVAEILQHIRDEQGLSSLEAEALYCGIYMDTKGFTFKTGARTFEAAAYLRKKGVDPVGVKKLFRNDLDMYIQKSKIISESKIYQDSIAIAVSDTPFKNTQLVAAQTADDLLNINGIEASFVLATVSDKVIISGRSLGTINVQVILEKLGGGGHSTIAGAQLSDVSLTIAELRLQNAIDEVLFEQ